jgi:hypothetical protein
MRAYVIVTGVIFGLVTLVHIWRMVEEPNLAREPWFVALTIATAVLTVGAGRLARRSRAS